MRASASAAMVVLALALGLDAQDRTIFDSLGTTSADANHSIISSFTSGKIVLTGTPSVFTAASAAERAWLVRGVIAAARAYTSTADFAQRYGQLREAERPAPEAVPQTGEEAQAAQMKQLETIIQEALKMTAQMPPQQREDLEENIAFTKRQLAELNADPKHRATVDAATREAAKAAEADYRRALVRFEADYPSDPRQLIARRLRAFLEMSPTIDFSAKLVTTGDKKMRFADPSLESMPPEWKMLYRAGKPAVDAARAAAEDWLKTLGG
jgi:hypothetical protein